MPPIMPPKGLLRPLLCPPKSGQIWGVLRPFDETEKPRNH
nr:MAG TPA: hypothetical protein [Caudoviricetes sp.]